MSTPKISAVRDPQAVLDSQSWDAVLLVGPSPVASSLASVDQVISAARNIDRQVDQEVVLLAAPELAGGRLIVSATEPVDRDQDDVRNFADAAAAAFKRAQAAGAKRPLLLVSGIPSDPLFKNTLSVATLNAAGAAWAPLEAREDLGEASAEPAHSLGVLIEGEDSFDAEIVYALEEGRRAARDVTGTQPERMGPSQVGEYCQEIFADSKVSVEIVSDIDTLEKDYPLMMAVGRASKAVPRHAPCVVRMHYKPEGKVSRSILLAGKGVVYDTGGADIKFGGAMAGMSRDKGGAGSTVGFMQAIAKLAPEDLEVYAEVGAVRNSAGADAFVSDEIIRSHAGVRVRIGNTDAEGRLVLADVLSHLRVRAEKMTAPEIYSLATLTGHAGRAMGPYSIAIENAPALSAGCAQKLSQLGELWGDAFEISRLRREDWKFVRPRTPADDVLSCNNGSSSVTARGHQFPMAFLIIASGLERHGKNGQKPIPYTHIDIGGSATEGGDWQHGRPTAAGVTALAATVVEKS